MKTIFNIAHGILGLFVWNYISHITGFSSYPHNAGVFIGIAFASFVFGGLAGGGHEWMQAQIENSNFDKWDILWTLIGFLSGSGTAVFFPQYKSEFLFDGSIVIYAVYWMVLAIKLRMQKKEVPTAIKLLLIGLSLLVLFVLTSCEKEIVFVPFPQREIPADYMSSKESKIIQLNNEHRKELGLSPYKTSLDLYHLAKDKALQLQDSDSLSHSGFFERYEASGALFFGESVAHGYETPESTLAAYYLSNDHRPMFESPIYEFIATACVGQYNCTLAGRWRPYQNNQKRILEVIEIRTGNISTIQIKP
jgi:hypothetical protein